MNKPGNATEKKPKQYTVNFNREIVFSVDYLQGMD